MGGNPGWFKTGLGLGAGGWGGKWGRGDEVWVLWAQELVLVWLRRRVWGGKLPPVCSDFPEAWSDHFPHLHILHQFRIFNIN